MRLKRYQKKKREKNIFQFFMREESSHSDGGGRDAEKCILAEEGSPSGNSQGIPSLSGPLFGMQSRGSISLFL